jgi:hypothetical protein
MILDLITPFRATANDDPNYNVQIKSVYPIENYQYKEKYGGGDSFEVFQRGMTVTINFINNESTCIVCDRIIEEFDQVLCIKNFEQVSFDLKDVESIVVE